MTKSGNILSWGPYVLGEREWHQLDDLWLHLARRPGELLVSYTWARARHRDWLEFNSLREFRVPVTTDLSVRQRLSTRPVVARPNIPVNVPPGEKITLYVGTPLWFALDSVGHTLLDIPVSVVSDTWFGVDTIRGEVCYDCETKARLSMKNIAVNPFKAISPVTIDNDSAEAVLIDRLNLPVPHLTLFQGADRHWTSPLTLKCRALQDAQGSPITIADTPPPEAGPAETLLRVDEPRVRLERGILYRTRDLLLG